MGLERDEVIRRVERRRIDKADERRLVLWMELAHPLERQDAEALLVESHHAAQHPIEGVLAPYAVRADPRGVEMTLEAVHPQLARLDHLLNAMRESGGALSAPLAAALASTIAHLAHQIHLAAPLAGAARVHRALRPGSVLLSPAGSVALLGAGLPVLDALLVPTPEREPDRLRYVAPEAARGEPIDSRSDVYALGALYYELSAREPYRAPSATSDLGQKALEGRAPDLPGTLHDPRESLVRLLRRALAPNTTMRFASALAFAEAVEAELGESGLAFAGPSDLSAALERYLTDRAPRGPEALVAATYDLETTDTDAPPKPAPMCREPPTEDLRLTNRPPTRLPSSAWRDLLEEDTPRPSPESIPPPSRPPNRAPSVILASSVTVGPEAHAPETSELPTEPLEASDSPAASGLTESDPPESRTVPTALEALYSDDTDGTARPRRFSRTPLPSRSRPRMWLVVAALVVVLVGLALYAGLRSVVESEPLNDGAGRTEPPSGAPAAKTPAAPPQVAAQPATTEPIRLLSVISQPSGATVELDGGYIGKTPLVLKHAFAKSTYTLTILQDGYHRWEKVVSPDPKLQTINVLAVLEKE